MKKVFSIMKNITWVASYPKSGNTWIRTILYSAIFGKLDINGMGSFIPNFAYLASELLGDGFKDPMDIKYKWLETQKRISESAISKSKSCIIKTHNAAGNYDVGIFPNPKFSANAIYIVRDPRDVAVSYSKHFNHSLKVATDKLNNDKLINLQPEDRKRGEFLSSWKNHVTGWKNAQIPVYIVKYEDFIENPYENISFILEFLKISPVINISEILDLTNFENLSKLEKQTGFIEASSHSNFFRKGAKSQWKRIPSKSFKTIENNNAQIMKELGYL